MSGPINVRELAPGTSIVLTGGETQTQAIATPLPSSAAMGFGLVAMAAVAAVLRRRRMAARTSL